MSDAGERRAVITRPPGYVMWEVVFWAGGERRGSAWCHTRWGARRKARKWVTYTGIYDYWEEVQS